MVTNKYKSILITAFFVVALCLGSNSMDFGHDSQEVTSYKSKNISREVENYSFDWFSWATYPIKSSMDFANRFISFSTKNPTYIVILGMTLAVQAANASMTCYCYCKDAPLDIFNQITPIGVNSDLLNFQTDLQSCQKSCIESGFGNILENLINPNFYQPTCGNPLDYPSTPGNNWNWGD